MYVQVWLWKYWCMGGYVYIIIISTITSHVFAPICLVLFVIISLLFPHLLSGFLLLRLLGVSRGPVSYLFAPSVIWSSSHISCPSPRMRPALLHLCPFIINVTFSICLLTCPCWSFPLPYVLFKTLTSPLPFLFTS